MSELLLVKGVAATEVEKKSVEELQLDVYLNVYFKNKFYVQIYKLQQKEKKRLEEDIEYRKQEINELIDIIKRCNQAKMFVLAKSERRILNALLGKSEMYSSSHKEYLLLLFYLKDFVDNDIQKKVIRFKKQSGLK